MLASVITRLAAAGCLAPEEEAAALLAATGDPEQLEALVARRTTGEPLAWLVGHVDFCGIRVGVDPGVYVPRWQTEPLARRAAALLPEHGTAVDLCTGAGAIARVLMARVPSATVVATDLDPVAAACAGRNGVETLVGDLDEPLPAGLLATVDVMTAVTPYVPADELQFLPRDVLAFEPRSALDGGVDGLEVLSTVVGCSSRWLRSGGWLLLELGGDQAKIVAAQMEAAGFDGIELLRDDDGSDRAIAGRVAQPGRQ